MPARQDMVILGAMQTETGLLLAGMAADAPLGAAVDLPDAATPQLLRFDLPDQGAFAFCGPDMPDGAGSRFVAWLPSTIVPDLPALQLRLFTRGGSTHRVAVRPESYRSFAAHGLPELYPQLTPMIDNMIELTQPAGHRLHEVVRMLAGALAAAPARHAATGAFDCIDGDTAHGWAWDRALPGARQRVDIVDAGGTVVARGHAEHHRSDLVTAGIGDGHHHFRITLPLSLRDGTAHRLSARLPATGIVLAGGPHAYRALPAPLAFFDMMPARAAFDHARRLASPAAAAALRELHGLIDNAQPGAAHDAALALLADHGDSAVACIKLGEALLLKGQAADAAQAYRRAQAADSQCPYACLGLGNSHAQRGDWIEAELAYRAGLALGHPCPPLAARVAQVTPRACHQRMRTLIGRGQTEEALAAGIAHLFAHPGDEDTCILMEQALGHGAAAQGESAQARRLKVYELLIGDARQRAGMTPA